MLERKYYTAGPLRHREYRSSKEDRIVNMAEELKVDELYLSLLSVRPRSGERRRALRFLSRIVEVVPHEEGFYGVEFNLSDITNKPAMRVEAIFENGLLQTPGSDFDPLANALEADITDGYFSLYKPDFIESELQGLISAAAS